MQFLKEELKKFLNNLPALWRWAFGLRNRKEEFDSLAGDLAMICYGLNRSAAADSSDHCHICPLS